MTAGRLLSSRVHLVWSAVSLLVLSLCLYYGYVATVPKISFEANSRWWVIVADPCPAGRDCVQIGDQILELGGVTLQEFKNDWAIDMLDLFGRDGTAQVLVRRGGEVRMVEAYAFSGIDLLWRIETITSLLPLVFWLMGTVAVLLLRPRDERWVALVLFSYVTALWFSSGLASGRHTGGAAYVFRTVIWFFLPLTVHLHTLLPNYLVRRRVRLLAPLYGLSAALMVLDHLNFLPRLERAYLASFLVGAIVSPLLLLARMFLRVDPAVRLATRIMLYGLALGFGPIILFFIALPKILGDPAVAMDARSLYPWMVGIALIAIPMMPMSYVYAIYKHHLGSFEFRANRLLGAYSFFLTYVTLYLLAMSVVSSRWESDIRRFSTATLLVSLLFVAVASMLRNRFQSLVDRHVLGIRHTAEEVIGIVSERIATAFDRAILTEVIVEEILPTLLVRRSALYLFAGQGGELERVYERGLPAGAAPPDADQTRELLARSGRYLPADQETGSPLPWVRVVLPLTLQGETLGVWLIGRRDPDDFFPASDIHLMSTIANQVAAVL
ncbi:MAG TPA: GAF domain-containing protein, partial [Thermoanaerobaculia bacterium]|nr:GAF domain-containing protein [Thermoanaerobaculia bacterium]